MGAKDAPWPVQYAGRYGFPGIVLCVVAWWASGQWEWAKERFFEPAIKQHVETLKELGQAVQSNAVTQKQQAETQAQQSDTLDALSENVKAIRDTQEDIARSLSRHAENPELSGSP